MSLIIDGLYISSLKTANEVLDISLNPNDDELPLRPISFVLSLGCQLNDTIARNIENVCYLNLKDTPETLIFKILQETNHIIENMIVAKSRTVLVHCVYGQSRSATVILSYLMHRGYSLSDALELLISKHPDICINPGFLAQLDQISRLGFHNPEFQLATYEQNELLDYSISISQYFPSNEMVKKKFLQSLPELLKGNEYEKKLNKTRDKVLCSQCKFQLANNSVNIFSPDIQCIDFIDKNVDSFWRGYRPITSIKVDSSWNKSMKLTSPTDWIIDQMKSQQQDGMSNDEGVLQCPQCKNECGIWKRKGILLCGGFAPSFMLGLRNKSILIR